MSCKCCQNFSRRSGLITSSPASCVTRSQAKQTSRSRRSVRGYRSTCITTSSPPDQSAWPLARAAAAAARATEQANNPREDLRCSYRPPRAGPTTRRRTSLSDVLLSPRPPATARARTRGRLPFSAPAARTDHSCFPSPRGQFFNFNFF